MKPLQFFFIASAAVHALLLATLLWISRFAPLPPGEGPGAGHVAIWIVAPGEGEAGNGSDIRPAPATVQRSTGGHRAPLADEAAGRQQNAPREGTEEIGGGRGSGQGEGKGGGGQGRAGDPRLAEIWKRIDRSKYYPEAARRERLEGSPRVSFSIEQDGSIRDLSLKTSCGKAILDEAAKETIRRAAPLPFYPAPITLAVTYELKRQ